MYIDGAEKDCVVELIADMIAFDTAYPDVHCTLLTLFNEGRCEFHQDLYHLALKVETLQMLCRELARELGERLRINVREEVERVNEEVVEHVQEDIRKVPANRLREFARWLSYGL